MALKGTIKDFGIADIFQLIGQQLKTGVLVLANPVEGEIRIYFQSGTVVRAEAKKRPQSKLLGNMMVAADLITNAELERALAEQTRTLKKIGSVLVDLDLVSAADVRDFAHLQMTDTIYSLFTWTDGTYEFEQTESVPLDEGMEPISADSILLEAVRMADEWPAIRKRLPSQEFIPERVKPLPEASDGHDGYPVQARGTELDVGPNERRVYGLIERDRPLRQLVHLTRLGEFETCRAVLTLVDGGYVRLLQPKPEAPPEPKWKPVALALRLAACAALAVVGLVMLRSFDGRQLGLDLGATLHYRESLFEGYIAETQLDVIRRALDVFRLQKGAYPEQLGELAEAGILRERDLKFPFSTSYYYRREGERYVLMAPLY